MGAGTGAGVGVGAGAGAGAGVGAGLAGADDGVDPAFAATEDGTPAQPVITNKLAIRRTRRRREPDSSLIQMTPRGKARPRWRGRNSAL